MDPRVEVYATIPDLESAATRELTDVIRSAIRDRGVCLMALSGGETPRGVYRRLGTLPENERVDWDRIHIVFADERMVPPDDAGSNFGLVQHEIIAQVPIPFSNVHRIRGEHSPEVAARDYGRELNELFAATSGRFDIVLLGLGEDGHTASLFPGTEILREHRESVGAVFVPRLGTWRVTLTLPAINKAREVLFLVSGKHKAAIVRQVLRAAGPTDDLPATLVRPSQGLEVWFLDNVAASALDGVYPLRNGGEEKV